MQYARLPQASSQTMTVTLAQQISLRSESSDANASCSVCSWPASPLLWNADVGLPSPGFSLHASQRLLWIMQNSAFNCPMVSNSSRMWLQLIVAYYCSKETWFESQSNFSPDARSSGYSRIPGWLASHFVSGCQWHWRYRFPRPSPPVFPFRPFLSHFISVHDSHQSSSLGFLSWSSFVRTSNRGNSSETRDPRDKERDQEIKRSKQLIAISSIFLAVLRAKSSQKSNCRVQVAEIFSWLHIRDMALRQCSETFRDFTKLRSHTSHTHSCEAVRGMWVSNAPSIFLLMCQPNVSLASSVTRLFCLSCLGSTIILDEKHCGTAV